MHEIVLLITSSGGLSGLVLLRTYFEKRQRKKEGVIASSNAPNPHVGEIDCDCCDTEKKVED